MNEILYEIRELSVRKLKWGGQNINGLRVADKFMKLSYIQLSTAVGAGAGTGARGLALREFLWLIMTILTTPTLLYI